MFSRFRLNVILNWYQLFFYTGNCTVSIIFQIDIKRFRALYASDGMVMHVDHIKPRSLYPHLALDIANLQIMCNECNVSKGNRDEVAWQ